MKGNSMTETERKALALVNEVQTETCAPSFETLPQNCLTMPLLRAIEQHEAFRQEVSAAVEEFKDCNPHFYSALLSRFILPETTRANHIAGAVDYANRNDWSVKTNTATAKRLEEVLARHGLEIREMGR